MGHLGRSLAAAAALLLTSTAVPAGAAPELTLEPEQLPRGAAVRVPHVEGSAVVDGDRRIEVGDDELSLLAATPRRYVVRATGSRPARILAVRRDGTTRVVLHGVLAEEAEVSADGRLLAYGVGLGDGVTEVRVRRVRDGQQVASRVFGFPGGFTEVVDLAGTAVLLGRSRSGQVAVWDFAADRVAQRAEAHRWIYAGDLRLDLVAAFTTGGERCSVLTRASDTARVLWRSCRERVLAFSSDGRRLATTDIRTDPDLGDEVTEVAVRTRTGRLVARYRAEEVTGVAWESGRALLLEAVGSSSSAIVRCVAQRCRTATEPVPRP